MKRDRPTVMIEGPFQQVEAAAQRAHGPLGAKTIGDALMALAMLALVGIMAAWGYWLAAVIAALAVGIVGAGHGYLRGHRRGLVTGVIVGQQVGAQFDFIARAHSTVRARGGASNGHEN